MDDQAKIIKGGLLVDGKSSSPIKDSVIVIEGERITQVGVEGKIDIPKGEVIDARGKVVMPGLIDSHVHVTISRLLSVGPRVEAIQPLAITTIEASNRLRALLESGFTSVMDCGAFEHIDLALRDAIERRLIPGPRLLCCGKAITTTGGHADSYFMPPACTATPFSWGRVCDGPDETRKATREEIRAGVDWIKLMHAGGGSLEKVVGVPQLTVDEMKAACEEAHKVGMKVCVHAQGTQSIKDSVLAGVDSIDHGYHLTEETADMMKERGITHKLTSLAKGYVSERRKEEGVPEIVLKKRKIFSYDVKKRALQLSMKRGVNVVACTDAEGDDNGVINAMEPAHWVYAGVTPMDAIVAMTRKPAELLDIEAGTIEVGKLADILLVDGNPLEKIEILQEKARIKMIMKQGRIEIRR